jgi:hypothetical protein
MFEALSYVGIAGNEDDGHTQQSKRELKKKKKQLKSQTYYNHIFIHIALYFNYRLQTASYWNACMHLCTFVTLYMAVYVGCMSRTHLTLLETDQLFYYSMLWTPYNIYHMQ